MTVDSKMWTQSKLALLVLYANVKIKVALNSGSNAGLTLCYMDVLRIDTGLEDRIMYFSTIKINT